MLVSQRTVALKFYEGFLNNISCLFPVASYVPSVLKKRNFKSIENFVELLAFVCSAAWHWI